MTPVAATATAEAGLSKRKSADDSDIAYMENELGKKPAFKSISKIKISKKRTQAYAENSNDLYV